MANTSKSTKILTSLHGRELGLTKSRALVVAGGVVSGDGLSPGAGTLAGAAEYRSVVSRIGDIIRTQIFIDLAGLGSSTTDLDVIGVGAGVAHIGRITTAVNGIIFGGRMGCVEAPTTGVTDIDLYSATVGTAVFDDLITALTETALLTAGAAWTRTSKVLTLLPAANEYLYLVNGAAGTVGTYATGQFVIELDGYAV